MRKKAEDAGNGREILREKILTEIKYQDELLVKQETALPNLLLVK